MILNLKFFPALRKILNERFGLQIQKSYKYALDYFKIAIKNSVESFAE